MLGRIEVLLMRHGEAEDWADGGDANRALTGRGRMMAVRVGAMLQATGLVPTSALASPFVRAQQTMQGVLEAAGARLDPVSEPRLVPGSPPAVAIRALSEVAEGLEAPRVLAVGHNPCVTGMLSQMVSGGHRTCFAVSPGDIAHLAFDPEEQSAVVLGYVPARVLMALAG